MIALLAVRKFLAAIPWQIYAAVILVLALWWYGAARYDAGYDKAAAEWKAKVEAAELEAKHAAAIAEKKHAAQMDDIESKLIMERAKGYEERERIIADLRAGTLRLRKQWQGCRAGLSEAGGSPGGGDGDAELREKGAADLIGIGREADAQLRACQAVIRADRESVR